MIELKNVAICGIGTPLGKELREQLKDKDCNILEIRGTDLRLPAPALAEKIAGIDGVINLYGEPYVAKWKGRYEFDIYRSRQLAIRSISNALRFAKPEPKFFITLSNAMVYDTYDVHDEYSSSYGDSFMSEVGQMETQEVIRATKQCPDIRLLLVRAGYLMSASGGAYPILARMAKIGWGGRIDEGYQCIPMVHVADAAASLIMLAENEEAKGVYNLTIPEMASMNELVKAFSTTVGKSQRRLPKFIIKLIVGRAVNLLEQNCKVVPSRLNAMGFKFGHPNVESIIRSLSRK